MSMYPISGIKAVPLEEARKMPHLKRSGVYCIISPNNKKYIGQSVNIYRRMLQYLNGQGAKQRKLYNSFNKYGIDTHMFCVLEFCNECQMEGIEAFYTSMYGCIKELNLKIGGANGRASEETKEKMRGPRPHTRGRIKSADERKRISDALSLISPEKKKEILNKQIASKIGKRPTAQTRNKMSVARKGKRFSEDHKRKIGEANKGKKKPAHVGEIVGALRAKSVLQFDLTGNFIKEYPSVSQAKRETGMSAINHCCTGLYKTAGGFIWKYKSSIQ